MKRSHTPLVWTAAVLTIVLLVLTVATIMLIQNSSSVQSSVPFDLDRITAQQNTEHIDISGQITPAFIGITADGTRRGISNSANICMELYRTVMPVLSETLRADAAADGDDRLWETLLSEEHSVYIRYHHEFPCYLLSSLAGASSDESNAAYIYEMFLLPYSEQTNSISVAVRSKSGNVSVFTTTAPEKIFTSDDLGSLLLSYHSLLYTFRFSENASEPVFYDNLSARNIIATAQTASMIYNTPASIDKLLRLFALNPDKLLNTHVNPDGSTNYIDPNGIFYIHPSSFAYTAVQDSGIPIANYIGYQTSYTLSDYLHTASEIFDSIRAVNVHFCGGDADLMLASAEHEDGIITLIYEYTFDNLRITGTEPAFTVTFKDGRLLSAELYTMSVRNLGTRMQILAEWWFEDYLQRIYNSRPRNIMLVYRSDFLSDSIPAEWCGEWDVPSAD